MKINHLISALILFGLTAVGYSQDKAADQPQQLPVPAGRGMYVDTNNNGICDNFEIRGAYYGFGRGQAAAPGYGRGQAAVQGYGRGQAAAPRRGWGGAMVPGQGRGLGPATGRGRGMGPGQGQGLAPGGRFFTDENKNGICDFYEESVKNQPTAP